jgi:hypothetical protein
MIDLPVGSVEYSNKNAPGGECVRPANMSPSAGLCRGGHSFMDRVFVSLRSLRTDDGLGARQMRQGATNGPYESGRRSR